MSMYSTKLFRICAHLVYIIDLVVELKCVENCTYNWRECSEHNLNYFAGKLLWLCSSCWSYIALLEHIQHELITVAPLRGLVRKGQPRKWTGRHLSSLSSEGGTLCIKVGKYFSVGFFYLSGNWMTISIHPSIPTGQNLVHIFHMNTVYMVQCKSHSCTHIWKGDPRRVFALESYLRGQYWRRTEEGWMWEMCRPHVKWG